MTVDWRARPYAELDARADKPLMVFLPWEVEAELLRERIAKGWIGGHSPVKTLEELLERSPALRAKAKAAGAVRDLPYVPSIRAGPPTKLWRD